MFQTRPCLSSIHKSNEIYHLSDKELNVKVIYLDDMLLLGRTREDLLKAMNSLIVLLQNLGFILHEII